MKHEFLISIASMSLFFGLVFLVQQSEIDAKIQQQQYCELVQLWVDTNGENGHPDYKKVAKHWCKPD